MTDKFLIKEIDKLQYDFFDKVNSNFINGDYYIQQDIYFVEKLKQMMVDHCGHNFNILGRYLSDGNSKLYNSWCRLSNIDELGKEWGQQYLKLNPKSRTEVCFNPKFALKIVRRDKLNKINEKI